jgi:hypothetical protein
MFKTKVVVTGEVNTLVMYVYEEKSEFLKLNTILNYMKSDVGRSDKRWRM